MNLIKNLKLSIIIHKIQTNCNSLVKIYEYQRTKEKLKFFEEWKNKIFIEKSKQKIENQLKDKYNKLYKNTTSETLTNIKNKEKNLEELKSQEKKISQNIKSKEKQKDEVKKKYTELEQKVDEVIKLNEKLEKEKLEKENLSNSNNTFSSLSRKEANEEIIKELEMKVIELDKEKNERDAYFKNFYDEMINMMVLFEQKTQKIIKMQNGEHHPKKLEINTGNDIYDSINNFKENKVNINNINNIDSGIRSKSKNKISSGSMSTTHAKKSNDRKDNFINYTDNFRNKIQTLINFIFLY